MLSVLNVIMERTIKLRLPNLVSFVVGDLSASFLSPSALINQEKLMESSERSTQPVLLVSAFSENIALTQVEGNIKSRAPEDCGIGLRYLTDLCGFFKAQISLGCTIHCQPEDVWNQCSKQIGSWYESNDKGLSSSLRAKTSQASFSSGYLYDYKI